MEFLHFTTGERKVKSEIAYSNSICQQIWKSQQWPQDWKRSVFIPIPKKVNNKECSNCRTIALISHASKEMLKILQGRLQQYANRELPDVQAGFRKGRGSRDQIVNKSWIIEKASSVKFSRSVLSNFVSPWTAAHQAFLYIVNAQSLFRLMSID